MDSCRKGEKSMLFVTDIIFTSSFGSGTKTINQFELIRIKTDRLEREGYKES